MGSTGINVDLSFNTNPSSSVRNRVSNSTPSVTPWYWMVQMYLRWPGGLLELDYRRNNLRKLAMTARNQSF